MSECLDAALSYAARGWRVLPVHGVRDDGACTCFAGARCTQPGKHPIWKDWTTAATSDAEKLADAWRENPLANVGVATGAASGFFALDVDPRHGGEVSLANAQAEHGQLPTTWTERTGGGGWHILFRHVAGIGNRVNALGQGLDVRGDGGQIVVAPSRHASGGTYKWAGSRAPGIVELADAPAWLVAAIRGASAPTAPGGKGDAYWRELFERGSGEGGRNDAVARIAGHLLRRRVDADLVLEVAQLWNAARCRPPLTADEVWTTVNSIAGKEADRIERRRARK